MEKILRDPRLYQFFEMADSDSAQTVRAAGCECCGGSLHQADYDRKPRGGPAEVMDRWDKRHSFCCEKKGCRKRHTPPSVRFLGRKVYIGIVVVLVAAMMYGPTARRIATLHEALGIDARTLERWCQWWLDVFVQTPFWKANRARFMPALNEILMPYCLVDSFHVKGREGLIKLMEFLSPITATSGERMPAM
jgi:hypothetical protein